MPFRHTDFEPDIVELLGAICDEVCRQFSITDAGQRQEVARQMIRAVMDGTTDPDRLAAVAINWIRKHPPPKPEDNGAALKAKKR